MGSRLHLLVKAKPACGTPATVRTTTTLRLVTCGGCTRTLSMADAEMASRLNRKNRTAA